ncbi:MAG TPA: excisionase family DNA-binding protein [Bacteroidia bacterium]|nr:excisionase family DNA-binding protein [Bacteroidia bacterium]
MKLQNRIDPSELTPEDFKEVERLLAEVFGERRPALMNASGERLELPQPVFDLLVHVLRSIKERRAVVMLPEDEAFTTQAAADYLGMSRPFLIGLLEKGQIPFHYVGSHRRILFRDLMDYESQRDAARREGMDRLFQRVQEAGLDDASYTGE